MPGRSRGDVTKGLKSAGLSPILHLFYFATTVDQHVNVGVRFFVTTPQGGKHNQSLLAAEKNRKMEKNRNFFNAKNVSLEVGDWPSICNLVSSFCILGHSWQHKTPTASQGDWATHQDKKSPFQSHISNQFYTQMAHSLASAYIWNPHTSAAVSQPALSASKSTSHSLSKYASLCL